MAKVIAIHHPSNHHGESYKEGPNRAEEQVEQDPKHVRKVVGHPALNAAPPLTVEAAGGVRLALARRVLELRLRVDVPDPRLDALAVRAKRRSGVPLVLWIGQAGVVVLAAIPLDADPAILDLALALGPLGLHLGASDVAPVVIALVALVWENGHLVGAN